MPSGMLGKLHSSETKRIMSEAKKGKSRSEETKKILSKAKMGNKNGVGNKSRLGQHISEEHKRKLSELHKGELNSQWKGGITPENLRIRTSIEIHLWREAVFARDNFTCQKCEKKSEGDLEAHHILGFAQYLELRTSIENGITFCEKCHKDFHKKYGKKNNTIKQLEEYLEH